MVGRSDHERGRDFVPTGRGGAGNAVRSPSRGRPVEDPAEVKAQAEYQANQSNVHGGRGGAGNVRSPSRDPKDRKKMEKLEEKEHKLQVDAMHDTHHPQHTGRGGAGNIRTESQEREHQERRGRDGGIAGAIRNFSRSRSREPKDSGARTEPHYEDKLGALDESSTLNGGEESRPSHGKPSIIEKISKKLS
ncbi:hypothetical protein CBS101457_006180 [Exobasidium rhododendri]|nr:hypothetical protein CBS101457_006180 [Exobasidium rhododendri]